MSNVELSVAPHHPTLTLVAQARARVHQSPPHRALAHGLRLHPLVSQPCALVPPALAGNPHRRLARAGSVRPTRETRAPPSYSEGPAVAAKPGTQTHSRRLAGVVRHAHGTATVMAAKRPRAKGAPTTARAHARTTPAEPATAPLQESPLQRASVRSSAMPCQLLTSPAAGGHSTTPAPQLRTMSRTTMSCGPCHK